MASKQRKTFLVYSRGMMPNELRLGSLFADPANPLDGEYKRFECPLSFQEMQEWLGEPEIEQPLSISLEVSRGWLISAGIVNALGGRARRRYSEEITVSGARGRRFRIQRPETFLNEVMLSLPKAREWITQQLSISRKMYYSRKLRLGEARTPQIWLLTGVQYIENASVFRTDNALNAAAFSVRTPARFPVASAASVLTGQQGINITLQGAASTTWRSDIQYHHVDERLWAAQFCPLKVDFSIAGQERGEESLHRIPLRPPPDHGSSGMRGSDTPNSTGFMPHEVAEIDGLNKNDTNDWNDNPSSVLNEMQDVDWQAMDEFWDEMVLT